MSRLLEDLMVQKVGETRFVEDLQIDMGTLHDPDLTPPLHPTPISMQQKYAIGVTLKAEVFAGGAEDLAHLKENVTDQMANLIYGDFRSMLYRLESNMRQGNISASYALLDKLMAMTRIR